MTMLPRVICEHVARLHEKGWPAVVEFPEGRNRFWIGLEAATVAQLEQAVEMETRLARKAIKRFVATGSLRSAETAAMRINRARSFAEWSLVNQKAEVTEAALPFPFMSMDEMKELLRGERED